MKNTILGLLAVSLIATPATAESWKTTLFNRLDTDKSGELTLVELKEAGCRIKPRLFAYSDADHSGGLTKGEYFTNRQLLGRCSK